MYRVILFSLVLGGCTPLISNVVMQGCGEEKVSLSNKADADQTKTPTTTTDLKVPLVGK